jgi:hypothetical protein
MPREPLEYSVEIQQKLGTDSHFEESKLTRLSTMGLAVFVRERFCTLR